MGFVISQASKHAKEPTKLMNKLLLQMSNVQPTNERIFVEGNEIYITEDTIFY